MIDERDDTLDDRRGGFVRGGLFGLIDVAVGVPVIGVACYVGGVFTWGVSCGLAILAVASDGVLAGWGVYDGLDADAALNDPNGLNASAEELFEQLSAPD